jgi:FAD/FMN-containing dehydrogenase
MTQTAGSDLDDLRTLLNGTVTGPDDADYDRARRLWNAEADRRPAMIAHCLNADDVANAVSFAVGRGLEIAVRGGAHSMPGMSSVDDGLVIDLSGMRRVTVDPASRRARVQGGALLGDLDAATQEHGLAVPAGMISHTGVGGLTLGGGMGWLTRKAGLTIDNMVSAEVVTADGSIRRASAEENADLFWAIRGGGGNFGVVTEFEFALHEAGPLVHLGMLFWGLDQGGEVLRLARDAVADLPTELNLLTAGLNAPPEPFVPAEHQLRPGYALMLVGTGSAAQHAEVFDRLKAALPPLFGFATELPYVQLQQMLDQANDWGLHCYDKSLYLEELSDEAIEVVTRHLPGKQSPLSLLEFYRLDGAYSEMPDEATAFSGGRSPRFAVFIIGICPTAELLAAEREWVRGLWAALQPYATRAGTYINGVSDTDEDTVRRAYGPKYQRLAQIKAKYDPANVFHRNGNIKPAVS